jgi:hypothetical protein
VLHGRFLAGGEEDTEELRLFERAVELYQALWGHQWEMRIAVLGASSIRWSGAI